MVPDRFAAVLDELAPLAARFRGAGHRLYIVGGSVRDLMVGRVDPTSPHFDIDLTTDARPDAVKACVSGWADAVWNQGEKFG
ncbi:MAG: CCA tRNA nucleotidyltransferase, partial [Ilumatobacteraceae bacterium]